MRKIKQDFSNYILESKMLKNSSDNTYFSYNQVSNPNSIKWFSLNIIEFTNINEYKEMISIVRDNFFFKKKSICIFHGEHFAQDQNQLKEVIFDLKNQCFWGYQFLIDSIEKTNFFANNLIQIEIEYFFTLENQINLLRDLHLSPLDLTTKEKVILDSFLKNYSKGLSRKDLMELCWPQTSVYHKTLDVHLFNLRKKTETIGFEIYFENQVWKVKINEEKFKNSDDKIFLSICSQSLSL